jgi:hypothetical protein
VAAVRLESVTDRGSSECLVTTFGVLDPAPPKGAKQRLSVPVELDGGVIGTLDIYAGQPQDWDPSEVGALQAYAGLMGSPLSAAVTAQAKGRLAEQLQAALDHRWLIEQAKGVLMDREELDAQAAFERLWRGGPVLDPPAGRCSQGRDRRPTPARRPAQAGQGAS